VRRRRLLLAWGLVLPAGVAAAAAPAPQTRVIVWGLQGDCTGTLAEALVAGLAELPVSAELFKPPVAVTPCAPAECAEQVRARLPEAAQRDALVVGGQLEESAEATRYRLWAYHLGRRELAAVVKWVPRTSTAFRLRGDLTLTGRTLLENFDRLCCLTEPPASLALAECQPVPTPEQGRRSSAILAVFNDAGLQPDRQRAPDVLQRLRSGPFLRRLREGSGLRLDAYPRSHEDFGNGSLSLQESELTQWRRSALVLVRWTGEQFRIKMCERAGPAGNLLCRTHARAVEDHPREEVVARELAGRLRELAGYATVSPPSALCSDLVPTRCPSAGAAPPDPAPPLLATAAQPKVSDEPRASEPAPASASAPSEEPPPAVVQHRPAAAPAHGAAAPDPAPRRILPPILWTNAVVSGTAAGLLGLLPLRWLYGKGQIEPAQGMYTLTEDIRWRLPAIGLGVCSALFVGLAIEAETRHKQKLRWFRSQQIRP
jgi:hypothetical protein